MNCRNSPGAVPNHTRLKPSCYGHEASGLGWCSLELQLQAVTRGMGHGTASRYKRDLPLTGVRERRRAGGVTYGCRRAAEMHEAEAIVLRSRSLRAWLV